jgi:hypothetical protein
VEQNWLLQEQQERRAHLKQQELVPELPEVLQVLLVRP